MSEKLYTWLLKLYPLRFRQEYGPSAIQLFRDRLKAERGIFQQYRFWFDVISDLAISVPREHWRRRSSEPKMPGSLRVSKEAVTAMTKREAIIPAFVVSSSVVVGLTIGWLGDSNHVPLLIAYVPLVILAMDQFRCIGKVERHWLSYQLILAPDRLQLMQDGLELTLLRSEIFKIHEDQHGLWVIGIRGYSQAEVLPVEYGRARERLVSIPMPAGLTGYEQIREQMLQWTGRISQRRSLWLKELKPLACAVSLAPAILLIRSVPWLAIVAALYYGTLLLAIMLHVARPPRDSGLVQQGVNLPPPAYMWRRFKRLSRHPPILILFFLPIMKVVLPR
jgi:hypothetical protein